MAVRHGRTRFCLPTAYEFESKAPSAPRGGGALELRPYTAAAGDQPRRTLTLRTNEQAPRRELGVTESLGLTALMSPRRSGSCDCEKGSKTFELSDTQKTHVKRPVHRRRCLGRSKSLAQGQTGRLQVTSQGSQAEGIRLCETPAERRRPVLGASPNRTRTSALSSSKTSEQLCSVYRERRLLIHCT